MSGIHPFAVALPALPTEPLVGEAVKLEVLARWPSCGLRFAVRQPVHPVLKGTDRGITQDEPSFRLQRGRSAHVVSSRSSPYLRHPWSGERLRRSDRDRPPTLALIRITSALESRVTQEQAPPDRETIHDQSGLESGASCELAAIWAPVRITSPLKVALCSGAALLDPEAVHVQNGPEG